MPATNVSSTPQAVYPYTGKNFAPSGPLKELAAHKRVITPHKLCDALKSKYDDYKKRDYEAFIEFCDVGKMIANLRTGKLLLMRHAFTNKYLFVKRDSKFADNKTVGGQFQFYSTKLSAEWLSSRPQREPICPSDDDQIEEFIAAVKIVQQYYDTRFFDTKYEELECLSAQDYGTWITRFRYDPEKKEIVCELLDFPACRWDIRFTVEESSYFIYESKCSTAVLKHLLDAEIGDNDPSENYGLKVIEQIATQGGGVAGAGKDRAYGTYNSVRGENVVTEMWLQPEAYCDIDLDADTPTESGISLSKGQSLLDKFPDGMCVVGIDEMNTIIGLYPENHKDHIVAGLYHVQSFSGVGKGISDAVDVMKELNDLHSQLLAHVKAHATPGFGYNSAMVSEEMARNIGKPRKNIPLDFAQAPDGVRSINDVVQAILPGNPAQAAFEYKEALRNDLQMAMQVTDFSNGLPGVDNKTATGAKIGDANAEMILVPQHLNKADHRKRADKVIYNLFKKFCDAPKFFATKDLNGITKGRDISGTQFADVDIDFEVVANSEVPQTPYQQKDSLSQLFQFTGGLPGLLQAVQMDPEMTGNVVVAFGAKLPIPKKTDIARVCRKRIEQAKKLLTQELQLQGMMTGVTGQPPDNTNLAASIVTQLQPPISSKEPYYKQKTEWLADLLDSDEMQYAPSMLRHVIEEMIDRHFEEAILGQAQIQQDQDVANVMGQLPMLAGEMAMDQQNQQLAQQFQQQQQQQQIQQQQQDAAAQNQQQIQQAGQTAQIQDKQSQADHQRALALNDQQHAQATAQSNQQHAQATAQSDQQNANALKMEALKQMGNMYQQQQQAKQQPATGQ